MKFTWTKSVTLMWRKPMLTQVCAGKAYEKSWFTILCCKAVACTITVLKTLTRGHWQHNPYHIYNTPAVDNNDNSRPNNNNNVIKKKFRSKRYKKKSLEMRGIDPRTSHMLSERSTTWATSPTDNPPVSQDSYQNSRDGPRAAFWRAHLGASCLQP